MLIIKRLLRVKVGHSRWTYIILTKRCWLLKISVCFGPTQFNFDKGFISIFITEDTIIASYKKCISSNIDENRISQLTHNLCLGKYN